MRSLWCDERTKRIDAAHIPTSNAIVNKAPTYQQSPQQSQRPVPEAAIIQRVSIVHAVMQIAAKTLTSRCSAQISPNTSSCHCRVESRAFVSTALSKSSAVILAASPPSNVAGVSRRIRQLPPPAATSLITQLPNIIIDSSKLVHEFGTAGWADSVSLGVVNLRLLQ